MGGETTKDSVDGRMEGVRRGVPGLGFGVGGLEFGAYLNTLRETETSLGGSPGSYETWSRQFA
jgi:hypothetical protein